jgi:hypothetical protein
MAGWPAIVKAEVGATAPSGPPLMLIGGALAWPPLIDYKGGCNNLWSPLGVAYIATFDWLWGWPSTVIKFKIRLFY